MGDREINVALAVAIAALLIFLISIFWSDGGDIHQAWGNVIGGVIGAAGAFIAVRETIKSQAEQSRREAEERRQYDRSELLALLREDVRQIAVGLWATTRWWIEDVESSPITVGDAREMEPRQMLVFPAHLGRLGLLKSMEASRLMALHGQVLNFANRHAGWRARPLADPITEIERVNVVADLQFACSAAVSLLTALEIRDTAVDHMVKGQRMQKNLQQELARLSGRKWDTNFTHIVA